MPFTSDRYPKGAFRMLPRKLIAASVAACALASTATAVEVSFRRVADGVYAHIGDIGARTIENERLNANAGLVVTPAETFAVIEQLSPRVLVPGHGRVTDLAGARADTRDYLVALRAHMKRAVDEGTDISEAVRSFDAKPCMRLLNAAELLPGNANRAYLELERE